MNKIVTSILGLLAVASLFTNTAKADTGSKREILKITREIEDSLLDSTASEGNLSAARAQLLSALKLIKQSGNGGGPISEECINYAYSKYSQTLNSADAMDRASAACRASDSMEAMKFLFDKYSQTKGSADAMDLSAKGSAAPMSGKLEILSYAYGKYSQTLGSADSATKAASGTRKVAIGSLTCIQSAYSKYSQTRGSNDSMDSSFAACAF